MDAVNKDYFCRQTVCVTQAYPAQRKVGEHSVPPDKRKRGRLREERKPQVALFHRGAGGNGQSAARLFDPR